MAHATARGFSVVHSLSFNLPCDCLAGKVLLCEDVSQRGQGAALKTTSVHEIEVPSTLTVDGVKVPHANVPFFKYHLIFLCFSHVQGLLCKRIPGLRNQPPSEFKLEVNV